MTPQKSASLNLLHLVRNVSKESGHEQVHNETSYCNANLFRYSCIIRHSIGNGFMTGASTQIGQLLPNDYYLTIKEGEFRTNA